MRTFIRRTLAKRRPAPVTGGTRVIYPVHTALPGYPYRGDVDMAERTAHFKLCRTLGEPV